MCFAEPITLIMFWVTYIRGIFGDQFGQDDSTIHLQVAVSMYSFNILYCVVCDKSCVLCLA